MHKREECDDVKIEESTDSSTKTFSKFSSSQLSNGNSVHSGGGGR